MKKFISVCITILIMVSLPVAAYADTLKEPGFDTYSDAYVVIDAQTGQVLVQKNMNKKEYPASITKIMTIALALERAKLTDKITMSEDAVFSVERTSSHIALSPGEVITLQDAIFGALLPSANDAANGIADYIGGSLEMFPVMMNAKAAEAGALNTHFNNANGLEDDNHYTTAYDMAMITKYALTVKDFREVFGTTEYTMQPTNTQPQARNFGTAHHMIVQSAYQYDGAWGGKLGWTSQANHTAVTVAKRGDIELICVVMNSKTKWEKYKDSTKLFDYCFDRLQKVTVPADVIKSKTIPISEGSEVVGVAKLSGAAQDYSVLVEKGVTADNIDVSLTAKVRYEKGEKIDPEVVFTLKNGGAPEQLLCLPLACEVIMDEPNQHTQTAVANVSKSYEQIVPAKNKIEIGKVRLAIAGILIGAVGIFLLLRFIVQRYYRTKRRRAYAAIRRYNR